MRTTLKYEIICTACGKFLGVSSVINQYCICAGCPSNKLLTKVFKRRYEQRKNN